jgi:surface protein
VWADFLSKKKCKKVNKIRSPDHGASLLEYGLLSFFIAVGSLTIVSKMGITIGDNFSRSEDQLSGAMDGTPEPVVDPNPLNGMMMTIAVNSGDPTYDFTFLGDGFGDIHWGDGTVTSISSGAGEVKHTYASAGVYNIIFDGNLNHYGNGTSAACSSLNYSENYKLVSVDDFGATSPSKLNCAFMGTSSRLISVAPIPAGVTSLRGVFELSQANPAGIESWDVSAVTSLQGAFMDAPGFNRDISSWNTAQVTTLEGAFENAVSFNQDISSWNVGAVKSLRYTFRGADVFNQPLDGWDTSVVTTTYGMFNGALAFDQDLSMWNVGSVIDFSAMFGNAPNFKSNISTWDVSSGVKMSSMFINASSFTGDLSTWDVSNVKTFSYMFRGTPATPNISGWSVSSGTTFRDMFSGNKVFNEDISLWDVSNVSNFYGMFSGASSFNQDISAWDISNVDTFYQMFRNASSFNQDLSSWTPKIKPSVCGDGPAYANFSTNASSWVLPQPNFDTCS